MLFASLIGLYHDSQCINSSIPSGRSYDNFQGSLVIEGCLFQRSEVFSGPGGVIYFNGDSSNITINDSVFYNCRVYRGEGAAIYIHRGSGILDMNRVCGYACSTTSYNYLLTSYVGGKFEQMLSFISVSNCSGGSVSISLNSGNQTFKFLNFSYNHGGFESTIQNIASYTSISSFCSYFNNSQEYSMCMSFTNCYNKAEFSYYNVIGNNAPSKAVFTTPYTDAYLSYAVFSKNKDTLFCAGGIFELRDSYIDHQYKFSTSSSISTINVSFTITNTYQIMFYATYLCEADIPVPTPTIKPTLEYTPIQSPDPTSTLNPTKPITPEPTIGATLINTLIETPLITPHRTPIITPGATIKMTGKPTENETPRFTNNRTPGGTLSATIEPTMHETPDMTPKCTHIPTLIETPYDTLFPTLSLTSVPTENSNTNNKKALVSVALSAGLILAIILGFLCISRRAEGSNEPEYETIN